MARAGIFRWSGGGVPVLLAVLATALYLPSLHAPWYMDDVTVLVQNPLLRDLAGSLRGVFAPRGVAIASFAVNYRFGGLDPFGYHLVNLVLHIGCGCLVFLLLRPFAALNRLFPALGALLFVAHPLQTQAVSYVVQRMTVLAAFFFLLAICLFVQGRKALLAGAPFCSGRHLRWYTAALVAGALAVMTKENTAVLPVVLYLYCVAVAPAAERRGLLPGIVPFAAVPVFLAAWRVLAPLAAGGTLAGIAGTQRLATTTHLDTWHYLVTEFGVLWIYLRMLVLPGGQALHHDYPVVTSPLDPLHLLAGLGLLMLGGGAWLCRHKHPLATAGIAWFLLTLAVESTVIPLDPLNEHRLYLPMFGFLLLLFGVLRLLPGQTAGPLVLGVFLLACVPLTWQRNRLWADPEAFYRDNLAKVPASERALADLADTLLTAGELAEAEVLLQQALARNPDSLQAGVNLAAAYSAQGRLAEALALAQRTQNRYPHAQEALTSLSALYYKNGQVDLALAMIDLALAADPDDALALNNRAAMLARTGRLAEAEAAFRRALQADPDNVTLRGDLVLALRMQGKLREAEAELLRAP